MNRPRILVIRLSALGDFVLSFGPFAAIRAAHPDAEITLLTTKPFELMAKASPWFDRVILDAKPRWWDLPALWRLSQSLRGFDFVYDLQTSGRSSRYFRLAGRPKWSGIAQGCSHPHANPARDSMHSVERQRDQLRFAGITDFPKPDLSWLTSTELPPELPSRFALLVPGAAPTRPAKRWPVQNFAEIAKILAERGVTPVVIGGRDEFELGASIHAACPSAIDFTGVTSLVQVFALAALTELAIGNDTGPMHIAASTSCPCIVLFSADSDPSLTAPRGPSGEWPVVLREPVLADLPVARVAEALS